MKKILVVDDDKDLLFTLKTLLGKNGYSVYVTTSCNEGLQIFYDILPDIVLLDINIQEEDGRDMCTKIKAHAQYQHIPVILMSADHDALQSYKIYGAAAIMEKPLALEVILETLSLHV